jgi:hypothetical protein
MDESDDLYADAAEIDRAIAFAAAGVGDQRTDARIEPIEHALPAADVVSKFSLGRHLGAAGRPEEALEHFTRASEIIEGLAAADSVI